jgi:hypothetical protein
MRLLNRPRRGMLVLALQPRLEVNQAFACFHQRRQFLTRGIVHLFRHFAECLGEPGDHLRVYRIVLRQSPRRQREVANPLGIDDPYLDVGLAQYTGPSALITAARLHHSLGHLVLAKQGNQLAVP